MTKDPNPALSKTPASSSTRIRFASLVLVFLAILALGAVAYFTEHGITVSRDWVIHTYQVRSQLNQLPLEVMRTEVNEPSSIWIHGKEPFPQSSQHSDLARQTVEELRRLTQDNPRQQERLEELGELLIENGSLIVTQRSPGELSVYLSAPSESGKKN